jgi:hypothetical protein
MSYPTSVRAAAALFHRRPGRVAGSSATNWVAVASVVPTRAMSSSSASSYPTITVAMRTASTGRTGAPLAQRRRTSRRRRRVPGRDHARVSRPLVVAIAATCYLAAAAFSLPWMAWVWIPLSFVVVFAGASVGLDPLLATAVAAAVLLVLGFLRGAARPSLTLETAGLLLYGSVAVGALLLRRSGWSSWASRWLDTGSGISGTCSGTAISSPRLLRRRVWRSTFRSASRSPSPSSSDCRCSDSHSGSRPARRSDAVSRSPDSGFVLHVGRSTDGAGSAHTRG